MADRTLYDILEVSETASAQTIRAAYERLSHVWGPGGTRGSAPHAALQHAAVRDAYLTLANPTRRATYDARLRAKRQSGAPQRYPRLRRLGIAAGVLVTAWIAYSHYVARQELKRGLAEQTVAAEKAKAEAQRRDEGLDGGAAGEQQLAPDKAELCRRERARYGSAASC